MDFLHWFIDPIKHQYMEFTGRATRQEFWMFALIYVGIYAILMLVSLDFIALLFSLALLLPALAITARRLHDIDMSGWWQLIGIIPLVGFVVMVVLLAKKGQEGSNRFGAPAGATTMSQAETAPTADPVMTSTEPVQSENTPHSSSM